MTTTDLFGAYVRSRLDHWGQEFALHRDCEYLGHQSVNLLQVLIDHKGEMPARPTGFKPLEVDAEAMQIEDIVTDIARGHTAMAICLRGYYCAMGRRRVERWETTNLLLVHAGLPMIRPTAYMDLAQRGEDRVYGVLAGLARAA